MNKRVQIILLSAFAIAGLCSYLVYRVVGNRLAGSQGRTTRVVVAAADVKLGNVLRDSDLGTVELSGSVPKGAITNRQQAIGRGVISDIYQGEPILETRLAAPGAGGGLAATIRQGMRACAIKVDEVVGVAGFVTPGMHVDVLISGNPPGTVNPNMAAGPQVRTLLQNIEVLSAGTDIQRDPDGKAQQVQVVNLLVTPEQAEQLSLASNQTKIQLVLRNPLDTAIAQPPGTAVSALFAEKNPPPPPPAPKLRSIGVVPHKTATPRVILVQVFNGSKRTDAKFVDGEEKQ
jgi:pilus assembly protein CpaB